MPKIFHLYFIMMNEKNVLLRNKVIAYFISFLFALNFFIFMSIFFEVVFPGLKKFQDLWFYLKMVISLALWFAVVDNLRRIL